MAKNAKRKSSVPKAESVAPAAPAPKAGRGYVMDRPPAAPEPKGPVVKHVGVSLRVEFDLIAPTEEIEDTVLDDVRAAAHWGLVRNDAVPERSRPNLRVTVQGGIIETVS